MEILRWLSSTTPPWARRLDPEIRTSPSRARPEAARELLPVAPITISPTAPSKKPLLTWLDESTEPTFLHHLNHRYFNDLTA